MGNVINENKGFESISRDLIFDSTLSDRARFVYVYMSAKPEEWDFYVSHMCRELGYSENTLRKYVDELLKTGWLERHEQKRNEDGTLGATQYIIKSSCDANRPQFHRGTNFTVRQNYRDGKIGTQRNIDNIEINKYNNKEINNNIENAKKPQNENGVVADFDTAFSDTALKMKEDPEVAYNLRNFRINDLDALLTAFKKHIAKNFRTGDFLKQNYMQNRKWLFNTIGLLDLSEATGVKMGPGEKIGEDGRRYYLQERTGKPIYVPDDAPPRPSTNHVWAQSYNAWIVP